VNGPWQTGNFLDFPPIDQGRAATAQNGRSMDGKVWSIEVDGLRALKSQPMLAARGTHTSYIERRSWAMGDYSW
jgi:hypothetical protein